MSFTSLSHLSGRGFNRVSPFWLPTWSWKGQDNNRSDQSILKELFPLGLRVAGHSADPTAVRAGEAVFKAELYNTPTFEYVLPTEMPFISGRRAGVIMSLFSAVLSYDIK